MDKNNIPIRPHHSLCIAFFEGKGYSAEFIKSMTDIIKMLEADDPALTVSRECDIVCASCPHNISGICCTDEKVHSIDCRCLEEYGLNFGDVLHWSELKRLADKNIISCQKLKTVCGQCQWQDICLHQSQQY
ncbi:MAG: DUF1284 domain-containing protein [Clostridia bacterium]|nr:DUF1284 domain-containing protein [Clostridia bacterium]